MKELRVFYQGYGERLWLGTLACNDRDMLFQYPSDALTRGLQLSPIHLPLREHAYPDRQDQYLDLGKLLGLLRRR